MQPPVDPNQQSQTQPQQPAGPTFAGGQSPYDFQAQKKGIAPKLAKPLGVGAASAGSGQGVGSPPPSPAPGLPQPRYNPIQHGGSVSPSLAALPGKAWGSLSGAASTLGNAVGSLTAGAGFKPFGGSAPPPPSSPASLPQVNKANAAMAPHAGGDGTAVINPAQHGGPAPSVTGPAAPGPSAMPQSRPFSDPWGGSGPGTFESEHGGSTLQRHLAAAMEGMQQNAQYGNTDMAGMYGQVAGNLGQSFERENDSLYGLQGKAALAHANPLDAYKDPQNLEMWAAMNNISPDQMGRIIASQGRPDPGGDRSRGYQQARHPELAQPTGSEPRTAAETLKIIEDLRARNPKLDIKRILDSQHTPEEYAEAGQPSLWDRFTNAIGFPGGYNQAITDRARHQKLTEE